MEQKRIIKIYEVVAELAPSFEVFVLPTRRHKRLFLFQDTQPHSDFDAWCIDKVYPFYHEIFDLMINEEGQYDYILFFDNQAGLVFYTIHPKFLFRDFPDKQQLMRFGHEQNTRVICPNISRRKVLQYLMYETPI